MSAIPQWPVAVVGAGPTGLTIANLLARYGVPVLLIERNPTTVQEPRAVSIDDESLRTMQAVGIVDRVMAEVVSGYGSDYFSSAGKCFLKVHPTSREFGYAKRNAFRQPVLERQLRDCLSEHSNIETWFCSELVDFRQTGEGIQLQVRRADGTLAEVGCDYLAACDGGRSFVREKLGIRLSGSTFRERWLIVDLEETNFPGRDTQVFCNPERPCIALPGPGRTRRFEFMLQDGEAEENVLQPAFVSTLLRLYSDDHTCAIRRKVVYTFHARMAERWREGRILLAGDAAHLTPPFAGQGMNSGIRDAHNLAWKLAAVVQRHLGPELLQTYEQERRGHAWDMIRLAMRMGRVMMPRGRVGAITMQTVFRALNIYPPARDYFAQMKYKPKPRFVSGFLAGRDKLVGRLFPQPQVVTSEGRTVLLDELLGNGFALVAAPATPARIFDQLPEDLLKPLRLRRVAVLARGAVAAGAPVVNVVDKDGELARALTGVPAGLVLLRPDHYVAAFLPAEGLVRATREVEALIARTWNGSARQ